MNHNTSTASAAKRQITLADIIEQMATTSGTLTFADGNITMPDGTVFPLAAAMQPSFILIQEGGTSSELYLHAWGSEEEAQEDRYNCEENGSYRTSPVIEIPHILAALGESFYAAAEELVGLVSEIDYPDERPEEDDEPECDDSVSPAA